MKSTLWLRSDLKSPLPAVIRHCKQARNESCAKKSTAVLAIATCPNWMEILFQAVVLHDARRLTITIPPCAWVVKSVKVSQVSWRTGLMEPGQMVKKLEDPRRWLNTPCPLFRCRLKCVSVF